MYYLQLHILCKFDLNFMLEKKVGLFYIFKILKIPQFRDYYFIKVLISKT